MMSLCPICRRQEAVPAYKPFCSKRCADVDLQRWFTGGYAIPTEEVVEDEKDR
ncbi:DNA gyrase inhibitor YacG [Brevundimonas sp. NPDC090276]|uniref:DNA gyrase inhibitor YacG n=1 Tax=Brevundimonas sp. NPDC090276 TaxID=3363956 RepID=UPI00383BD0E8